MESMKIIAMIMVVAVMVFLANCAEEGEGMSNSENTYSAFRINNLVVDPNLDLLILDPGGSGSSVINTMDHTFTGELAVDPVSQNTDPNKMTGINVTHYKIDYFCDDPRNSATLESVEVPIQFYMEPNSNLSLTGYLAMPSRYYTEYINENGGTIPHDVLYELRFTFYGVNQFGQEVKVTGSDYAILNQYVGN